jgi:hypothetical protein
MMTSAVGLIQQRHLEPIDCSSVRGRNLASLLRSNKWHLLLSLLALGAYCLLFGDVQSTSLSFTGYDLAEWAVLHPTASAAWPIVLASLALRLVFVGIYWQIMLQLSNKGMARYWLGAIAFVGGLALLPPIEFFTVGFGDVNYQQQAGLTIALWIGATIIIALPETKLRLFPRRLIAVITIICCIFGVIQTRVLFGSLGIESGTGIGPFIIVGGSIISLLGFNKTTG